MNTEEIKSQLNSNRFLHRLYDTIRLPRYFIYDCLRFMKFYMYAKKNHESELCEIIIEYHAIERGLTMSDMHLGFGQKKLLWLMELIDTYIHRYGKRPPELTHACRVIGEYYQVHKEYKFTFPPQFDKKLYSFVVNHTSSEICHQTDLTDQEYWSCLQSPFDKFARSRHSIRHFEGNVDESSIQKAVELANCAPSACNRQYVRIHCICNRALIEKCFSVQRGNRGFGHMVDKLIILTVDLRYANQNERNDVFTNAGIYCMNLSYALHFYKVAHCILNWAVPPSRDKALRQLIQLPQNEEIVIFIACGGLPSQFKVTSSPRKDRCRVLNFHR